MSESTLTAIEQIAVDTLSVLYHSDQHTAQFYILDTQSGGGEYTNILYAAEPVEDTEAVLGAGILSLKNDLSHAYLWTLFPVGMVFTLPIFSFE